jgi:hypothetical protein
MKPPKITCRCCQGSGKIDLPADLFGTLKRVRGARKPVGTEDLMEPGIGRPAIANRLKELERNGLVVKAGKRGKEILWMNACPQAAANGQPE